MFSRTMTVAGLGLVFSLGCGGSQTQKASTTPSFSEYQQRELESERKEFIAEGRKRLDKLESDIALLETKIEHESKFVDEQQRAKWSQELFEDRQEKMRLEAELARAKNASAAEWAQMRGTFGRAVDTVEASIAKIGAEIGQALASTPAEPEGQAIQADVGLCPVDVAGAQPEVNKQSDAVVVTITTPVQDEVMRLREGAQKVAAGGQYRSAKMVEERASETMENALTVTTQVENIDQGVKIVFVPSDEAQLDMLAQQLEGDMQTVGSGRCQVGEIQETGMR